MPELLALRNEIDAIDNEILTLLNKRALTAHQVAAVKRKGDLSPIFYRPEREAHLIKRMMNANQGPLANEKIGRLFREIMSVCLDLEAPLSVAFLGPMGTFTHAAAKKHFGMAASCVAYASIDDVFRAVLSDETSYGVVPVENSTEGAVNHTLDAFLEYDLRIIGEVSLRIHQHLLVAPHTKQDKISAIYGHQQALAQCRKFLSAQYPNARQIPLFSNGEGARRLAHEWHSAAVAGDACADEYGLSILHHKIEDNLQNTTRFLVIGKEVVPPSGEDKTSILVSMPDKTGALIEILKPLEAHGITLTSLETRPEKGGTWAYVFFIDLVGHAHDAHVKAAIDKITTIAKDVRVLGGYPKAVL